MEYVSVSQSFVCQVHLVALHDDEHFRDAPPVHITMVLSVNYYPVFRVVHYLYLCCFTLCQEHSEFVRLVFLGVMQRFRLMSKVKDQNRVVREFKVGGSEVMVTQFIGFKSES